MSGNSKRIKRDRGQKPDAVKESAKHWRKLRTKPYEKDDYIGVKFFQSEVEEINKIIGARNYPKFKNYSFYSEVVRLTVVWAQRELEEGRNPFLFRAPEKYKGCRIIEQQFADDVNWIFEQMNLARKQNNPNSKTKSYEHCLKWAALMGIKLLYWYNVVNKEQSVKLRKRKNE